VAAFAPRPDPDAAGADAYTYVAIAITTNNAIIPVTTDLNVHTLRYFKLLRLGRGASDQQWGSRNNGRGGRSGEHDLYHLSVPSGVNTQRVTGSNQQSSLVDPN
jgi:hypothetical protein